ncbi:MAG TPA: ABC transporter substrate-binding protein, partial [Thermoplasmataceae archaeon]|nr:ABC transporter substrate-binding protein [Thermoplasmataceae archaeon]
MNGKENNEKNSVEPSVGPVKRPAGGKSSGKWIAVIIALLAVIGVLGGVLATHYTAPQSSPPSATLSSQLGAINQNSTYTTNITATKTFQNATVYFGDGTSELLSYSGSNTLQVKHVYKNPGEYYIFADINYGSSQGYFMEPVKVNPDFPNAQYAYRSLSVDPISSSPQLVNNLSNIFTPGSHMVLDFLPAVGGGSYQIVEQTLTMSNSTSTVSQQNVPYVYNLQSKGYVIPIQSVAYGGLKTGIYSLEVNTTTAPVNTTQTVVTTVQKNVVMNFTANQNYTAASGTRLANISMAEMQFLRTNVTYAAGSSVNYTTPSTLYLGTMANITVENGTVTYKNETGTTFQVTAGNTATLNASTELSLVKGTNLTFNTKTTTQLNDTHTTSLFYGANTSVTVDNGTVIKFISAASNVSVTYTLEGTTTIPLNNGQYDSSRTITTTYFIDFPVVSSVSQQTATSTSFTNAEPQYSGGYNTLDPAVAYYTADSEILYNTLLPLDTYNGTSTSSFIPLLAAKLPSASNGGVNTNWQNSSTNPGQPNQLTTPSGVKYNYTVAPGTNYTFYINNNTKFANGDNTTAWDVMYSLTRDILFAAGSPGTPGWIIAQYLLPGNLYVSNTFYNITQNMTVDNSTNSITFHFQTPMSQELVYQIFEGPGTSIMDAKWLEAHGAGINWTPKGFQDYKAYGNQANYNIYVQNHVMPDGPYKISYIVPGSQVTLAANPDFVSPGPWYPTPSISRINILYSSSNQQAYLLLKSGQAQNAVLSTQYWNQTQDMVNSGQLSTYGFSTLGIYFFTYNLFVNTSILHSIYSQANLPASFFMNPNVRKAFSYAFNYSEYFDYQVGNKIYNTTFFSPYVGMLPPGMLYNQTEQQMTSSGTPVINSNGNEPFQISQAKKYLNYFLNGTPTNGQTDVGKLMNVTYSNGKVLYNNKQLVVPLFVPTNYPSVLAGATTWSKDLAQIM